jgi:hypothetical protein
MDNTQNTLDESKIDYSLIHQDACVVIDHLFSEQTQTNLISKQEFVDEFSELKKPFGKLLIKLLHTGSKYSTFL